MAQVISSQTLSHMNTPTYLKPSHSYTYLPMKMEQAECSETSAYKIQTLGNYPEESIQHSEQGESLKSRTQRCIEKQTKGKIQKRDQFHISEEFNTEIHSNKYCTIFLIR
jgi:hypothetical protein